ncbi:MAG: hypothetical protein WCK09_12310 [Bacteroidota bacterium]
MYARTSLAAMNVPQTVSIAVLIIGFIAIWIHLEICIAEINDDLSNLKSEIRNHFVRL